VTKCHFCHFTPRVHTVNTASHWAQHPLVSWWRLCLWGFSTGKSPHFPYSPDVVFGKKSLCAIHTEGVGRVQHVHELFGHLRGIFSPPLLTYEPVVYVYQHGLSDIYLMLWAMILCYLFCYRKHFSLALSPSDIISSL
jgi:hypothetical protein